MSDSQSINEPKIIPVPAQIAELFQREAGIDDTWAAIQKLRVVLESYSKKTRENAELNLAGVASRVRAKIGIRPYRVAWILDAAYLDSDGNPVIRLTEDTFTELRLSEPVTYLDYEVEIVATPEYIIYNGRAITVKNPDICFVQTIPGMGSIFNMQSSVSVGIETTSLKIEQYGMGFNIPNLSMSAIDRFITQFHWELERKLQNGGGYKVVNNDR